MSKFIDRQQKVVYMPKDTTKDIIDTDRKEPTIVIDETHKYKKNKFYCFWQWTFYYLIAKPIIYLYGKFFLGVKIKGKKNLKKLKGLKTGYITLSNHVHYVDFALAATFIGHFKRVHIISQKDTFDIPFVKHIANLYDVLPLPDTLKASTNLYKQIDIFLKNKHNIHIFPEASLWPYYTKIRPFKSGAFHFAIGCDVPIVPFIFAFRPSKGLLRKRPTITISIGEPQEANKSLPRKEQIIEYTERVNKVMQELIEKENSYVYWKYVPQEEMSEEFKKKNNIE